MDRSDKWKNNSFLQKKMNDLKSFERTWKNDSFLLNKYFQRIWKQNYRGFTRQTIFRNKLFKLQFFTALTTFFEQIFRKKTIVILLNERFYRIKNFTERSFSEIKNKIDGKQTIILRMIKINERNGSLTNDERTKWKRSK